MYFIGSAELQNAYSARGALFGARAAGGAFHVVNACRKVFHFYSTVRASLDALHAADAAYRAVLACFCALVVVDAQNGCRKLTLGHKGYYMLRADGDAFFARSAHFGAYDRNAVTEHYCIIRTGAGAVAESQAAVRAGFRSAEKLRSHLAALNAVVIELVLSLVGSSGAADDSRHGCDGACGKSHYFGNLLRNLVSARVAQTRFGRFARGQCGGVAGAARETARAAVCTGENFFYLGGFFVNGNRHDL